MKMLPLWACLALLSLPGYSYGQNTGPSEEPQPRTIVERIDIVEEAFEQARAITANRIATSGWGALADMPTGPEIYQNRIREIRSLIARIESRRATPSTLPALGLQLREHFDDVDLIYDYPNQPLPPGINTAKDAITLVFLDHLSQQNQEFYRQFFVKYGSASERLNLLEAAILNEYFSGEPTGISEGSISPWEPVARIQVVGYQWALESNIVRPSSPTAQLGITYYFFGSGTWERALHHVGVAAAYQYVLGEGRNLGGLVAHVRTFDFGLLCSSWSCEEPVLLTSVNLQLFQGFF
jgi:hypothetical protein